MAVSSRSSIRLGSLVDYDRVHRATGGLLTHIDTVIDALAFTDLNWALSELDAETLNRVPTCPELSLMRVLVPAL